MTCKVHDKLKQVAGISGVEETHLTLDQGKWLVVANKACIKPGQEGSRPHPQRNDSEDHCPKVQQPTRHNHERT